MLLRLVIVGAFGGRDTSVAPTTHSLAGYPVEAAAAPMFGSPFVRSAMLGQRAKSSAMSASHSNSGCSRAAEPCPDPAVRSSGAQLGANDRHWTYPPFLAGSLNVGLRQEQTSASVLERIGEMARFGSFADRKVSYGEPRESSHSLQQLEYPKGHI